MSADYYALLGVEPTSDIVTIAAAVGRRELYAALKPNGSPEEMMLVAEAWNTLSDPDKRKRYNTAFTKEKSQRAKAKEAG